VATTTELPRTPSHPFSKSLLLMLVRLFFFCPHFFFGFLLPFHECPLDLTDRKFPLKAFDVRLVVKHPVDGCGSIFIARAECSRVHVPHPLDQIEEPAIDHQMQQSVTITVTAIDLKTKHGRERKERKERKKRKKEKTERKDRKEREKEKKERREREREKKRRQFRRKERSETVKGEEPSIIN